MSRRPDRTTHDPAAQDAATLLRRRAQVLAKPLAPSQSEADTLELLEFRLGEERYAFEAAAVRDVQPLRELTPLPGTPEFIAGVANVRGRVLAVVDFKRFFGLGQRGITDLHGILLLGGRGAGGIAIEIGLLVDTVAGVHSVRRTALQAAPASGSAIEGGFLRGVTEDRLAVLDAAAILADPRLVINEDVEL